MVVATKITSFGQLKDMAAILKSGQTFIPCSRDPTPFKKNDPFEYS